MVWKPRKKTQKDLLRDECFEQIKAFNWPPGWVDHEAYRNLSTYRFGPAFYVCYENSNQTARIEVAAMGKEKIGYVMVTAVLYTTHHPQHEFSEYQVKLPVSFTKSAIHSAIEWVQMVNSIT